MLWDVTIDGRLARRGLADPRAREARRQEFAATFAMLGDEGPRLFDDWFDRMEPTHRALLAFAQAPNGAGSTNAADSGRCPLCHFPVAALDARPGPAVAGRAGDRSRRVSRMAPANRGCARSVWISMRPAMKQPLTSVAEPVDVPVQAPPRSWQRLAQRVSRSRGRLRRAERGVPPGRARSTTSTVALVKLAVSVGCGAERTVHAHAKKALRAGADAGSAASGRARRAADDRPAGGARCPAMGRREHLRGVEP